MPEEVKPVDPELQMLLNNKEAGFTYRQRRHPDWEETYTLYRDRVITNRLIQRQSVNLPIMKQSIRTLLKDVDDMPVITFENLDNDKEAEIFQNEYWKLTVEENNMELQDIVDKRQVFLFGRSFDQWQIVDGKIKMTIQDPQDISVSPYTDPTNLHSSRFLCHEHIFEPLSMVEANPEYDQKAVKRLKDFYATRMGIVKVEDNLGSMEEKNRKMANMGYTDVEDPVLGEAYVEKTLHFVWRGDEDGSQQIWLYVEAENQEILMKSPLEKIIGVTKDHFWQKHFPYNTWADDLERQDFWSDGVGDVIRPANKVGNVWFSQEVERRTLSNFGMQFYDSSLEGFTPNSFNPAPWGWYPIPVGEGKTLRDVVQKVDVPANDGNLEIMSFLIGLTEKATGASSTQQGAQTERKVTLGEVQLALGEAKERIKGMSKFYTPAWKQRGQMFLKLIEAAPEKLDAVKIYKKGKNTGKMFTREIGPSNWMTPAGYITRIWSQDDKETQDTNLLQKLLYAKNIMPNNPKLSEIHQRKSLEFAGLTPDEIAAIMEYQQQEREAVMSQLAATSSQNPMDQMGGQPAQPQLAAPQQMMA